MRLLKPIIRVQNHLYGQKPQMKFLPNYTAVKILQLQDTSLKFVKSRMLYPPYAWQIITRMRWEFIPP